MARPRLRRRATALEGRQGWIERNRGLPPANGTGGTLTVQERAILAASAAGLASTEVAATLDHTPETVRAALASAIIKLGARSELEAIATAVRRGLIEVPTEG